MRALEKPAAVRHSEAVCETLTDYRVQKQTSDPARERERQRERRSQRVLHLSAFSYYVTMAISLDSQNSDTVTHPIAQ